MRRITSLILAVLMIALSAFAFASCDKEETSDGTSDANKAASNKFGVQAGTTGYSFMHGDADWGFTGFSNIDLRTYENANQAVADMKNGNIGYVVIDADVARDLVEANQGIKMIDVALTTEAYGIAVDKNQAELLANINKVLADKKADIDAIFKKYENIDDNNAANWAETAIEAGKYDANNDNQLVVATNAAFAPFEFTVGDKFAGIDMEIAKLIADELEMELVIVDMAFEAVAASVGNNGIDIALSGMTINDVRKKIVNFSEPYYTEAYQVVICMENDAFFNDCDTTEKMLERLKGIE